MKQERNPVRQAESPKPPILSQTNQTEFPSQNPRKYAGNCHPPRYEPSMKLEMLHQKRKTEVETKCHLARQQQQQKQQQQRFVTTGNRYNLDCQSCMLVQMGEKVQHPIETFI